ncbi:CarD family transcriptional regulator [Treponema ruminis]|uniref:Anti-sigma regulatory factor (Ser/Thr protein kinase) n=1 Tax=Treponema ruminis TaxID=744515 RepID=A0A7W8G8X4_9SPIR|nr:cyclic nucleotide-binding domain-containing protein [Treponema ruminis]MBB5225876.1 anti-sigma regulatory factor (Ser/Thr protein kinase) [Treponema ruminis]QSI03211.1 CarD family transcriptional regulator [Treponema ruminis]
MRKVLTASSNKIIINTVKNACELYPAFFATDIFDTTEEIIRYIDYELPEIKVIDFTSENIDCDKILQNIADDTWLHYGGVIAVCNSHKQVEEIEHRKNPNILAIQTVGDFQNHFTRILRILYQNQRFLFNRGMRDIIGSEESASFTFGNDPMDCLFYTNFLVNYLYNTNRISDGERFSLQMTFSELVTNALEHGNLEIDYDTKSDWLNKGGNMIQLIRERAKDPRYAKRRIKISYNIGRTTSQFSIADDGNGFNWRERLAKAEADESMLHGRGISLSKSVVQSMTYNEKGNEVTFTIANLRNTSSAVPGKMTQFETVEYKDKDVVCREGEYSNDLFFILSGRFAVYANNKLATVLTPNDLFIGEMAFLLNDRRTATILAVGDCRLIRIPKADFLLMIRKNPHYGIFLSKMLAQRLLRQTNQTIELKKQVGEKA